MIQLNRLEGFYWVAKTGGYAKAARAFPYPITQPAVYQQVKKLEAEVGVALFERAGKDTILLTPAGRKLHEFVEPFFAELKALTRALRAGDLGGELRVQASALFLRHLMPAWIRRLARRSPQVRIDLQELPERGPDPLRSGDTDLVVTYLDEDRPGVETRHIADLHAFLVLPADHRLAERKQPRLRDLAGDPFVGFTPGTLPHELQLEELARHGVVPQRTINASSADTILGFVESGVGYSLVPSLREDGPRLRGVVAKRLTGKRHRYPVYAAWRESSNENPLITAALAVAPTP